MTLAVDALDHLVMNVKDVETAATWYERVLGMKRVVTEPRPGAKVTSMHFGRQKMNLRPETATQKQWFTGRQIAPGSDDPRRFHHLPAVDPAPGDDGADEAEKRSGEADEVQERFVRIALDIQLEIRPPAAHQFGKGKDIVSPDMAC